jgi:hypothetical protein
MSQNPSSYALRQQLSIGNVVNVSFNLYRAHLKLYSKLALTAHLWLFVPIYGWAKFYAISALISQLAFNDLSGQQESLSAVRHPINRQMWNFLVTAILVIIISLLGMFMLLILFSLVGGLLIALLKSILGYSPVPSSGELFKDWLYTGIAMPFAIAVYLSPLWFYSRFFIIDLILLIEGKISSLRAIDQSWELTKGFRNRLIGIILLSFLVTFPMLIIVWQGLNLVLSFISYNILRHYITNSSVRFTFRIIALTLVTGVIIMPFWQAIKAVAYYDIRCRRESFDLKLRDSLSR